ncbi:MAG: DUF1573 domain-containing protein [Opitutales bacterium]|nr:DUF1573 domain-containing protein [Opitutales bacterium]
MRFQHFISVCASLLLPPALAAELVFEQDSVAIEASWSDERVRASFAFVNRGDSAVEIVNVRTSCGCTAAKPTQTLYEPGEHGTIDAAFDIGSRQGMQRNRILVETSSGIHSLNLAVDIPVAWSIDNRVLVWRSHEEGEVKHARVRINDPRIVSVELADSDAGYWKVELREEDQDWVFSAVPREYESQQRQALRLLLQREDGSGIAINLLLRMF